mmetsp:Transcript_13899/g.30007  ORF Transcript_13899/g.30007 Transcript_13899/m.30007 type:complete len:279 (+) Transcript_13899:107-943(+)
MSEQDSVTCPGVISSLRDVLAKSPGDLTLQCSDGTEIKVHRQVLQIASLEVFNAALQSGQPHQTLEVDGTGASWYHVLTRLYPGVYPRPELNLNTTHCMLPVAHKYGLTSLQQEILDYLHTQLPSRLSTNPSDDAFVLRWLALADDLQLDSLQGLCVGRVRSMAAGKKLGVALLKQEGQVEQADSTTKCSVCSRNGHIGYRCTCCNNLWCIGGYPRYTTCPNCGQQRDASVVNVVYHQDTPVELNASVKALSRPLLEALLASVVAAAAAGQYVDSKSR